jgi:AcrR family transcriptional regulator
MCPAPSSKEIMLDAAEAIVLESGARHLTLDAVAARANVSKGGVLYHFPTKEALLKAMVERFSKQQEETLTQKVKGFKEGQRGEIKAFILSGTDRDPRKYQISSALLAAVAHDPTLLQPLRDGVRRQLAKLVESGLGFDRASIIFFAVFGLIFSELLSLSPLDNKKRQEFVEQLLCLAEG